ncbi:MAG: ROK family protein [Erysipelotrichaceae bacterium]|nr:ROK family protein [Erysipelotrichaceae bacterium]
MQVYVGVDCGGTWTRVGKMNLKKEIVEEVKFPSLSSLSGKVALNLLIKKITEVVGDDEVLGIGIALCGVVVNDTLSACSNLPALVHYPIKEELQKAFKVPVYLDNDANTAALCEAMLGSGKEFESVYYLTFSTGAGGAYVLHQQVVAGSHGCAGEISFLPLKDDFCGNDFTGKAIERRGNRSTKEVFEGYGKDEVCTSIIEDVIEKIGAVLACISLVIDPDVIILSGGMMASLSKLMNKLEESYEAKIIEGMKAELRYAMFDEPGVLGAALLGMSRKG